MIEPLSLTDRLRSFSTGDREADGGVLREVFPKLRQIAQWQLRRRADRSLASPTELVQELWIRHLRKGGFAVRNREHFYSLASRSMRHVLIDFARQRLASKRGGPNPLIGQPHAQPVPSPEIVVELGMAMEALERCDVEAARIVDLHYVAGYSLEEIASVTGLTLRQVRVRWERGRDWLKERLPRG